MKHIKATYSNKAAQALRMQSAREQSAMHAVNLAVARWSNIEVETELARALPSSSRSRWHAAAQDNFMAWLNAGGFAQAPEPAPSGAADAALPMESGRGAQEKGQETGCGCAA